MLGDFAYRGFVVRPRRRSRAPAQLVRRGGDDHEHTIRTPAPFLEAFDAFAAAQGLARAWIDQRR